MEKRTVKIAKRTFPLAFTLGAMEELEQKIENFNLSKLQDYVKSPSGLMDILLALMRQGELLEGRILDVDRTWLASHLSPSPIRMAPIQIAILNTLSDGLTMEAEQDEGEVDVVLEEIKKKETTDE